VRKIPVIIVASAKGGAEMIKSTFTRFLLVAAIAMSLTAAISEGEPLSPPSTQPAGDAAFQALPTSRPSDSEPADLYALAKAKWESQEQACLANLKENDAYKSALADLDQAKQDRATATGDDIASAAQKLMSAMSVLHERQRDALAKDPNVVQAKRELDTAPKASGGIRLAVLPPINRSVLLFAEQSVGKTIGNGECWTPGAEALKSANSKPPDQYVFGRELDPKEAVLPGDIIQFTSVRLQSPNWWVELGTPHHTAVIQKVESKTVYVILGQNPGPVAAKRIDLQFLRSGTIKIYRALPS
jgi:hypothetical protein